MSPRVFLPCHTPLTILWELSLHISSRMVKFAQQYVMYLDQVHELVHDFGFLLELTTLSLGLHHRHSGGSLLISKNNKRVLI